MENTKKFYVIIKITKVWCCGIGNTPEEAFEKSRKWLPSKEGATISNTPFFPLTKRGTERGGLCIAKCTPRFVEVVKTKGGAAWVRFETDSEGMLDTKEAIFPIAIN